jgi:hypothetical protein
MTTTPISPSIPPDARVAKAIGRNKERHNALIAAEVLDGEALEAMRDATVEGDTFAIQDLQRGKERREVARRILAGEDVSELVFTRENRDGESVAFHLHQAPRERQWFRPGTWHWVQLLKLSNQMRLATDERTSIWASEETTPKFFERLAAFLTGRTVVEPDIIRAEQTEIPQELFQHCWKRDITAASNASIESLNGLSASQQEIIVLALQATGALDETVAREVIGQVRQDRGDSEEPFDFAALLTDREVGGVQITDAIGQLRQLARTAQPTEAELLDIFTRYPLRDITAAAETSPDDLNKMTKAQKVLVIRGLQLTGALDEQGAERLIEGLPDRNDFSFDRSLLRVVTADQIVRAQTRLGEIAAAKPAYDRPLTADDAQPILEQLDSGDSPFSHMTEEWRDSFRTQLNNDDQRISFEDTYIRLREAAETLLIIGNVHDAPSLREVTDAPEYQALGDLWNAPRFEECRRSQLASDIHSSHMNNQARSRARSIFSGSLESRDYTLVQTRLSNDFTITGDQIHAVDILSRHLGVLAADDSVSEEIRRQAGALQTEISDNTDNNPGIVRELYLYAGGDHQHADRRPLYGIELQQRLTEALTQVGRLAEALDSAAVSVDGGTAAVAQSMTDVRTLLREDAMRSLFSSLVNN